MRELKITHLYPELLNLYGDKGNIAALKCRAEWRDISVSVTEVRPGENIDFENTDILFLGGGSDKELKNVIELLLPEKEKFVAYAENGGVILAVCEGFPLLGKTLVIGDENTEGLGVLDIISEKSGKRLTGDVMLKCDIDGEKFNVTGFENRELTVNTKDKTPFGKVVKGNGEADGIIYKNVFASFLHGPLLPKNPRLTDILLKRALVKKYGETGAFSTLDDSVENEASSVMEKRINGV